MIRIFYEYINEFINDKILVLELEHLYQEETDFKIKEQLLDLISLIKIAMIKYQDNTYIRYDVIYNLFLENELFQQLRKNITNHDLMVLITDYEAKKVPVLNQEKFDELVDEAIKDNLKASKNCYRLAINYLDKNINFSKVEDYLIKMRETFYLTEYIYYAEDKINLDSLITKIILTKDKKFIMDILNCEYIDSILKDSNKIKLKNALK